MVAFVIVTHSEKLAEGIAETARMMAPNVSLLPAGGLPDGRPGTSRERVTAAIQSAAKEDGVIVLFDIGSARMTAELVLEELRLPRAVIADCPLCEGAITGAVLSESGAGWEEILSELSHVKEREKL